MQGDQIGILFIKDIYLNIQKVIKISSKILGDSINAKEKALNSFPTNLGIQKEFTTIFYGNDVLAGFLKTISRHKSLLELDKIEILMSDLDKQLQKCPKKIELLEIKSLLYGLNEKDYKYILDMFFDETDELKNNIKILNSNWGKLFELSGNDIIRLKSVKPSNTSTIFFDYSTLDVYYSILSILLPVILYLETIEDVLTNHFIKFLENELVKITHPKTFKEEIYEEQDVHDIPNTLNSIMILLDKIDFFKLPKVEKLGENKKGELIAFLTKYKASTCKTTIKEMSESPNAVGKNNPYKSEKAKKDANNFLTKLSL